MSARPCGASEQLRSVPAIRGGGDHRSDVQSTSATVDVIAVSFVLTRVVFIGCYVADRSNLRSTVWLVAFALNVSLFFVAAFAGGKQ